jgi:hypothetical protein
MKFKKIRSFVGKFFSERTQMHFLIFASSIFWKLRKYFLGVDIKYPEEFVKNWKLIKSFSSQDMERNFTIYQLVKMHNNIFEDQNTNLIEFGTDRGGTLTTISKFIKENSKIFAVDSFGLYSDEINKNISHHDEHYQGSYKPFTKETRFKNFDHENMTKELNEILAKKNSSLETYAGYFPNLKKEHMDKISSLKYSFVHLDFDLYQPTIDCINFLKNRLEKNAIILVDDFNFINQEGVQKAISDLKINLNKGFQTQSGQLIFFNKLI